MAALARELAKRHEVTVLTSRALDLAAESRDGNVRVIRTPVLMRRELAVATMPSMLSYVPSAVWRGIRMPSASFDIINTHFAVPTGPVGQLLASWHKIPNVLSVHGGDLYDPSKRASPHRHAWLRVPVRSLLKQANVVVAQSRNTLQHVDSIYGVKRSVELIPLGIERPPSIAPADRAAFGVPPDALVLVTIGRLVARKSTAQLVKALAHPKLGRAYLIIVGSGPDEAEIRLTAQQYGVTERVRLLGHVSDEVKYQALSAADLFVSSSQHEGFGLVFLEAMAFGLPVVCYDEGGQIDFLTSGQTGFVVKLNQLESLSAALVTLAESDELRSRCSAENRERVQRYFIDRCANHYQEVFESALSAAHNGPRVTRKLA